MKSCPHCKATMPERTSHERRKNFCSNSCRSIALKLGNSITIKGRERLSRIRKGKRNPNWKGDELSYGGLHARIRKQLKKPVSCQFCGRSVKLELANVSQKYLLVLNDWIWLCAKCHTRQDGRNDRRRADGTYSKKIII